MNNRPLLNTPYFYFYLIIILYSTYDYYEHITRRDSLFEAHPWDWGFFSLAAVLSLILIITFCHRILVRIFKKDFLVFEVIAFGTWLTAYIYLLGPLFNTLFWDHSHLQFNFKPTAFLIILGIYFLVRFLINLIINYFKKRFSS